TPHFLSKTSFPFATAAEFALEALDGAVFFAGVSWAITTAAAQVIAAIPSANTFRFTVPPKFDAAELDAKYSLFSTDEIPDKTRRKRSCAIRRACGRRSSDGLTRQKGQVPEMHSQNLRTLLRGRNGVLRNAHEPGDPDASMGSVARRLPGPDGRGLRTGRGALPQFARAAPDGRSAHVFGVDVSFARAAG